VDEESTVIIRKVGDKQYLPIVNYRGDGEHECETTNTPESAMRNAWQHFRGRLLLDAAQPPAEMTL
jgi:hypothetical protein